MFDCTCFTPRLQGCCCSSSSNTPQSEPDIPFSVLTSNGDANDRREDDFLRCNAMFFSSDIFCDGQTVDAQQADLAPTTSGSRGDGQDEMLLSNMNVNLMGGAKKCTGNVSDGAGRGNKSSAAFGRQRELYADFSGGAGLLQTVVGNGVREPKESEENEQKQERMCSPDPENSVNQMAALLVASGHEQPHRRRLTSLLPDGACDAPHDVLIKGQVQNEIDKTHGFGTFLLPSSVMTGAKSHTFCDDTGVIVSLGQRPDELCLPPQNFSLRATLESLGEEQKKQKLGCCAAGTCLANVSSLVDCERTGMKHQHHTFSSLASAEVNTSSPGKTIQDLMTDNTATVFDTSAPRLVDWQVVIEESFSLDLAVEGSEVATKKATQHLDDLKRTCTSLDVLGEVSYDACEPLPPPASSKKQHRLPPLRSQLQFQPHSLLQKSASCKQLSCSSESAVCTASWPPSIAPVDDCSVGNGEDAYAGTASQNVVLSGLLSSLAVTNSANRVNGLLKEDGCFLRSPPPLSGGIDTAYVPLREACKLATAPLALVVEVCRAVRPFARRLLLLLLKESNGRANVSIDTCTEALNRILQEEGVCSVRATRCLCRSIVSRCGFCVTDRDMVSYVNFVASAMELAEGT